MKKVLLLFLSLLIALPLWGQDPLGDDFSSVEAIREMMKKRQKIFKRMFDDMGMKEFFDDDFFKGMAEDLQQFEFQGGGNSLFDDEWVNTPTEGIFVIKTKEKAQLEINVKPEQRQISISSKQEEKEENQNAKGQTQFQSFSSSSFQYNQGIPSSLDANAAQMSQDGDLILICFPRSRNGKKHPDACKNASEIVKRLSTMGKDYQIEKNKGKRYNPPKAQPRLRKLPPSDSDQAL